SLFRSVEKDTPILELETDKINLEINAETEGIITEITKPVGSDVVVGDVIGVVGDKESFTELNVESSDNDQDAEFSTIKDKDKEKETEYEALKQKEPPKPKESNKDVEETSTISEQKHSYIRATPAARKKARELGIDLTDIKSRLQLAPLTKANLEKLHELSQEEETEKAPVEEKQEAASSQHEERVRMSRRRMTIAKRLVDVQRESAMLTTFNEIDLTEVMKLRKERKETFIEQHDVKL